MSEDLADRLRRRRQELNLTQEKVAEQLRMTPRYYGDIERRRKTPRRKGRVEGNIAKFLGVSSDEIAMLSPSEMVPRSRRIPPSQTLLQLPGLENSIFWSRVLFTALDYASDVDTPQGLSEQALRRQPPRLAITPMIHADKAERWERFLAYAVRYRTQVAGCLIAPPSNLPRGDQKLIERLRDAVSSLLAHNVNIICLDRRFPWENEGILSDKSLPAAESLSSILFIGNEDRAMGKAAAECMLDAFGHEGISQPRVGVMADDLRLTTAAQRLAGIKEGLGTLYDGDLMEECRFDRGNPRPGDYNCWGVNDAADKILAKRPHGIITVTSSQAQVVVETLEARNWSRPWPAICALDGERVNRLDDVSYATYTAKELATKALECLTLLRQGRKVTPEWCKLNVGITNITPTQAVAKEWAQANRTRRRSKPKSHE